MCTHFVDVRRRNADSMNLAISQEARGVVESDWNTDHSVPEIRSHVVGTIMGKAERDTFK